MYIHIHMYPYTYIYFIYIYIQNCNLTVTICICISKFSTFNRQIRKNSVMYVNTYNTHVHVHIYIRLYYFIFVSSTKMCKNALLIHPNTRTSTHFWSLPILLIWSMAEKFLRSPRSMLLLTSLLSLSGFLLW
jgi:hypothetical protein